MDVKQLRLSVGPVLMQSVRRQFLEADMNSFDELRLEITETPALQRSLSFLERGNRCLKALKRLFRQRFDFNSLSVRLRRDAGIDEQDLERAKVAKAPLIR